VGNVRPALVALAFLVTGCSGSDDVAATAALPAAPAQCAGTARTATAEARQSQWEATLELLSEAEGESVEVWIGFSDVLSVEEASAALPGLDATGVFLAYEDRQGTYVKSYYAPEAPREQRALAELAQLAFDSSSRGWDNALLSPADPAVRSGAVPVVGVRVIGSNREIAGAITADECLIYSLAPGAHAGPDLTTAVEP
jgi:hypothetical protein